MKKPLLSIKNLSVSCAEKNLLIDLTFSIPCGSITVIMGPNGSGKSSLAYTLMGHPRYTVTSGSIVFDGEDITTLSPDKRSQRGLFLSLQNPLELDGVTLKQCMRQALAAQQLHHGQQPSLKDFTQQFSQAMAFAGLDPSYGSRAMNVGFSGGEKKKSELVALALLKPKLAILDEIDSGLDIDALKTVCAGLATIKKNQKDMTLIIITHYSRILQYLQPDCVHILQQGSLVCSGGVEIVHDIEAHGYQKK